MLLLFGQADVLQVSDIAMQSMYLVDFEWAGPVGTATYLYFMNHADIQWPDGAGGGRLVTESHDLWWLSNLQVN